MDTPDFTSIIELVMKNSNSLVFVKDENSVILYANDAFLNIYPPDQRDRIIGTTTVENFSPEEAQLWLAEDRRAMECGETEMVEEIQTYAGKKITLHTRKIRFMNEHKQPRMLGICTDITDLAQREKELAEANRKLEQYSSIAAHDLRSPLSAFINALTLVKMDTDTKLSEQSGVFIDMAISITQTLCQNVSNMLDVVRAKNTGEAVRTTHTDLNVTLEEVRFSLHTMCEAYGASIYINRLPSINVNKSMMMQLFQNLIENSLKYRSGDTPPVIFIRSEKSADDRYYTFTVSDNGKGADLETCRNAFDLFSQGSKEPVSGAGIGLHICRKIVEIHGGDIRMEPGPDGGVITTFTISASIDPQRNPLRQTEAA